MAAEGVISQPSSVQSMATGADRFRRVIQLYSHPFRAHTSVARNNFFVNLEIHLNDGGNWEFQEREGRIINPLPFPVSRAFFSVPLNCLALPPLARRCIAREVLMLNLDPISSSRLTEQILNFASNILTRNYEIGSSNDITFSVFGMVDIFPIQQITASGTTPPVNDDSEDNDGDDTDNFSRYSFMIGHLELTKEVFMNGQTDDNGATCGVCLENFEALKLLTKLPCSHKFHNRCIVPWLLRKTNCPICRYQL